MDILVIGCGQVGSRHIQSLASAKFGVVIYALDNSDESLQKAKIIFNKVENKHKYTKLIIVKKLVDILTNIDMAIVASNSNVRAQLILSVLDKFTPKHIILEKVLFNKIADYKKFEEIFNKINTKVWVNQYMGYEFSFLSKHFNSNDNFHMKVSGNWGLCCNSVHYIEIFHHLCGRIPINLKSYSFETEYKKSKRDGYFELFGTIDIVSSKSQRLTLECSPEKPELVKNIEIMTDSKKLIDTWVDEYHNCNFIDSGVTLTERHYSRRQSERTLDLVVSLKDYDSCSLPSYQQSSFHHLLILEQFRNKFFDLGIDATDEIPIT